MRRIFVHAVVALSAVLLYGCGGSDPSPGVIVQGTVATVITPTQPGLATTTQATKIVDLATNTPASLLLVSTPSDVPAQPSDVPLPTSTLIPVSLPTATFEPAPSSTPAPVPTNIPPAPPTATWTHVPTEMPAATLTPTPRPISTPVVTPTQSKPSPGAETYSVVEVVDGDTIRIDMGGTTETLRLIGIDTPETRDPRKPVQCFGKEASDRAKLLLVGQRVRIAEDPTQDTRDKYGRLLAYVWRADGLFYNYRTILDGYAHEYTYNTPYQFQAQFRAAENEARENGRGLWSTDSCGGDTTQPATPTSAPEPRSTNTPQPQPTDTPGPGNYITLYVDLSVQGGTHLNVRAEPSLNAAILGKLYEGDTVEVVEHTITGPAGDEWYKTRHNGRTAYLLANGLSSEAPDIDPDTVTMYVDLSRQGGEWINIRKRPSTDSDVLGRYYPGDAVEVIAEPVIGEDGKEWYKTTYNDQSGYLLGTGLSTEPQSGSENCDPSYPGVCIPAYPPDLDCDDVDYRGFDVAPPDPHGFDGDGDGVGCERD